MDGFVYKYGNSILESACQKHAVTVLARSRFLVKPPFTDRQVISRTPHSDAESLITSRWVQWRYGYSHSTWVLAIGLVRAITHGSRLGVACSLKSVTYSGLPVRSTVGKLAQQRSKTPQAMSEAPDYENILLFVLATRIPLQLHIKLSLRRAQTCALPLFCDRDLEINPMYPHTKNTAATLKHSKLRPWLKNTKMSQGQRSRSKCQKLRITSSVVVTYIPIKPQQFPDSSFWVACYRFFAAVTFTWNPRPWTHDLETEPWLRNSEDVSKLKM